MLEFLLWILVILVFLSLLAYLFLYFEPLESGRAQGRATGDGKHLVSWKGSDEENHIYSENGEPLPFESKAPEIEKKIREDQSIIDWAPNIFGYWLVGIRGIHSLYGYEFERNKEVEFQKPDGTKAKKIELVKDRTTHVRLHEGYPILVSGVETSEDVRVDIKLFVTIQMTNLTKAIITYGGKWFSHLTATVESAVRDWSSTKTVEEIRRAQIESNSDFLNYILNAGNSEEGNPSLDKAKGVKIISVNFTSLELTGTGSQQVQDALTAEMVEKKQAAAKVERAVGAAKEKIITAKADAIAERAKGDAEAYIIRGKGKATAEAAQEMINVVHEHPEAVDIINARATVDSAEAFSKFNGIALTLGEGFSPVRLQYQCGPAEAKTKVEAEKTENKNEATPTPLPQHKKRKGGQRPEEKHE